MLLPVRPAFSIYHVLHLVHVGPLDLDDPRKRNDLEKDIKLSTDWRFSMRGDVPGTNAMENMYSLNYLAAGGDPR